MRRCYGSLLILLICMAPPPLATAQPATHTMARLPRQPATGWPKRDSGGRGRGLIYQAFLGSGTLLVLSSYVTNSLLVAELLRGQIQVGDQEFEPHPCHGGTPNGLCPQATRVAGDLTNNEVAPTYADMSALTGKVSRAIGERTGATFTRDPATGRFVTGSHADLATDPTTLVEYDPVTEHNIARVFWQYMNQRGPVLEGERLVDALVVDPLYAFGRPLTDPYWIRARVNSPSNEQIVLVQLFERRVLTYTPANPDPFNVEMGNVGQHYYLWRYGLTRW